MPEKTTTTLLAIRHGETLWNAQDRFQGHGDSPLTETGRRQARALGQRLKGIEFDVLIASDLGRAKETASILAEYTGHPVGTDARLRERSFGELEGLTVEEIRRRHPGVFERLYADDPDYAAPKGETLRDHFQRNISFVQELLTEQPGITAALVVHGGVLDSLFRYVARLPLYQPRCFVIANTSLSRFSHGVFYGTRRWVIESWGDMSHLAPVGHHEGL
jgi:probable phosphoglycerate mutase